MLTLHYNNYIILFSHQHLRQVGVVGKFVEFYGPGVAQLSIADRATISNMCPEYGATVGFFPVDEMSLKYLKQTGKCVKLILETKFHSLPQAEVLSMWLTWKLI